MVDLAVLSVVLLLAALLLWAWRERGRAIAEARLAEAEARRARLIDSAAADAADLLAGALTSLGLARDSLEHDDDRQATREWLGDAERATRAIAGMFESARVYVKGVDGNRVLGAEACVRLAVAIARAEGRGVALRGEGTELACSGSPRAAIAMFCELLGSSLPARDSFAFVTVEMTPTSIVVKVPAAAPLELDSIRRAAQGLGWSVSDPSDDDPRVVVIEQAVATDEIVADVAGVRSSAR